VHVPDDCEVFWIDPATRGLVENLSAAERSRAAAFRRPEDRALFVATRSALRELLGERLGVVPARLDFVTNEYGKPRLREGDVHFNVAHCEGHAVIALRRGGPVGVDVEVVSAILPERDEIATRVLSDRQRQWLRRRPEESRTRDFMRLWVLKEAFAKCLGVGLSGPLRELEAEIGEDGPRVRWLGHPEMTFAAFDLSHGEGVVAALVIQGQIGVSPAQPQTKLRTAKSSPSMQ
jgi:4'-phosphopantetheinyl transferase